MLDKIFQVLKNTDVLDDCIKNLQHEFIANFQQNEFVIKLENKRFKSVPDLNMVIRPLLTQNFAKKFNLVFIVDKISDSNGNTYQLVNNHYYSNYTTVNGSKLNTISIGLLDKQKRDIGKFVVKIKNVNRTYDIHDPATVLNILFDRTYEVSIANNQIEHTSIMQAFKIFCNQNDFDIQDFFKLFEDFNKEFLVEFLKKYKYSGIDIVEKHLDKAYNSNGFIINSEVDTKSVNAYSAGHHLMSFVMIDHFNKTISYQSSSTDD